MAYFKIQYSSQVGSNDKTSDLYSGSAQSEAQTGHQIHRLRLFLSFSSLSLNQGFLKILCHGPLWQSMDPISE
jgi:hypothetical protein